MVHNKDFVSLTQDTCQSLETSLLSQLGRVLLHLLVKVREAGKHSTNAQTEYYLVLNVSSVRVEAPMVVFIFACTLELLVVSETPGASGCISDQLN